MSSMGKQRIYVVYSGDNLMCVGTANEVARVLKKTVASVRQMATPSRYNMYLDAVKNNKKSTNLMFALAFDL